MHIRTRVAPAAIARGTDGVSEPLFPVLPESLSSSTNTTLADLTDGNLAEGGTPAFAFTNPLFIDYLRATIADSRFTAVLGSAADVEETRDGVCNG